MALNPITVGDNPQQPNITSEVYLPDQLIAGPAHNLVTDSVTVSGAAALLRGTVLGQTLFGTATASTGKAYGSGTIVVAALPSDGDTLTINTGSATVITFHTQPSNSTQPPPANQQWIAASINAQAAALCEMLNASTDANLSKMTYSVSAATVTCTSKIIGTGGNAYTIATSDSSAFTVGGALTGGTANTGTSSVGSISLGVAALPGKYTITAASTSATSVLNIVNPQGDALPAGVVGTAYKNAEINFTITDATTTAADTFVITTAPTATGVYKISVATAVDGSEAPSAILADYCDPTGGNVTAGVYLSGEFNINAITVDPSWTPNGLKQALRPLGIFLKSPVSAADPA